jgi:hypothetical protein
LTAIDIEDDCAVATAARVVTKRAIAASLALSSEKVGIRIKIPTRYRRWY